MSCILDSISQPAQIVYLQGASNYTWVHYRDGQKLLLSKPLLYFEAALPSFLRVHKTALVNPRYIQDVTAPPRRKMPGNIHLINGITLPVGRRRWHPLLQDISQAVQLSDEGKNNFYTHISTGGPFNQPAVQQRLYVATANEIKAGLVQQLIEDHWPEWGIHFFDSGSGLLKTLAASEETNLPGMILLDAGPQPARSLFVLETIKNAGKLKRIPTLLMAESDNGDLVEQGYAVGANSVILHPTHPSHFVQALERVCRYWLRMASAPRFAAFLN
ncbi:response regulator transcription factor [Larkinella insperata]|uniref:Response regulator transcription factor n=1 Tax=Larkinella insperata TaxID=332158 RepID=A0ABW3QKB2_9BACT|nr:LytTR family transcriptional regulator DNA-binding domain-containing protein [Larkinella insperata]